MIFTGKYGNMNFKIKITIFMFLDLIVNFVIPLYTQPSAIAPNWCRYGRAIAENAIAKLNN